MEQHSDIQDLFEKYMNGSITQMEYNRLMGHLAQAEDDHTLDAVIEKTLADDSPVELDAKLQSSIDKVDAVLIDRIFSTALPPVRKLSWLGWAAAAILFLSTTLALHFLTRDKENQLVDIVPAVEQGLLHYPDGSKVVIKGKTGLEKHATVEGPATNDLSPQIPLVFETPAGSTYTLRLSDGTKVVLNALSSLKYPSQFIGDTREVELVGEAYFEVAKDAAHPFVVKTKDQLIKVLGTSFNVEAYGDGSAQQTALLEGSVQLSNLYSGEQMLLVPGDLAAFDQNRKLNVKKADVSTMALWKDGYLIVQDQSLATLIRKLERWYDVTFDLGSFSDKEISGIIQTNANLSEVLKGLEINTGLSFHRVGRRINTTRN